MLHSLKKLIFPLSFVRIEHAEHRRFCFVIPGLLVIFLLFFDIAVVRIPLFGPSGIIQPINGLLSILSAFYIASLAAVATFNKPGMDEPMKGDPPVLRAATLSRRQYLSMLFGYLAFCGIVLFMIGIFLASISGEFVKFSVIVRETLRYVFVLLYFLSFFNLLVVTLLGLYFLTYRIHREDVVPRPRAPA